MNLLCQHYEKKSVGKLLRGSKLNHVWQMLVDNQSVYINLFESLVSKKIRVEIDGVELMASRMDLPQKESGFVIYYQNFLTFRFRKAAQDLVLTVNDVKFLEGMSAVIQPDWKRSDPYTPMPASKATRSPNLLLRNREQQVGASSGVVQPDQKNGFPRPSPKIPQLTLNIGAVEGEYALPGSINGVTGHRQYHTPPTNFIESHQPPHQHSKSQSNLVSHHNLSIFGRKTSPQPDILAKHLQFGPESVKPTPITPSSTGSRNTAANSLSLSGLKDVSDVVPFIANGSQRAPATHTPTTIPINGPPTVSPTFDKNHLFFRNNANFRSFPLGQKGSARTLDNSSLSSASAQGKSMSLRNGGLPSSPYSSVGSSRPVDPMYPNPFPYEIPNRFAA
jgi:hypothetical protein